MLRSSGLSISQRLQNLNGSMASSPVAWVGLVYEVAGIDGMDGMGGVDGVGTMWVGWVG